MRNDPSDQARQANAAVGRGAAVTCYAALALTLGFLVALLVVDHHETKDAVGAAAQVEAFGIEELVDLLTAEPFVTLPVPKARPVTRAELDAKNRR